MNEKRMCHICLKTKISHDYDNLDLCTRCLNKVKDLI